MEDEESFNTFEEYYNRIFWYLRLQWLIKNIRTHKNY
jgi:hypothetical protein